MSDKPPPKSEIILYQTEDGRARIECRFENETIWLSLNQMAELFQTTKQNVSLHIQNIFAEGELQRGATVKESLTVQPEGKLPPVATVAKFATVQIAGGILVLVRRILRKYGYPPDKQDKTTQTVLEQAKLLCADWAGE
jgi:hypothetical protein